MNLRSRMNEYEARAGSNTMMDFSKGDPLKNTNVNDMHKQAGAKISFNGANGSQQMGVIDRFQDGSSRRVDAAMRSGDMNALSTANNNHFDTMNDRFAAFNNNISDNFKVVLLI